MTRLPDELLNIVVYLYGSREGAERGTAPGGSGFIVTYPVSDRGALVRYLVTAEHVRASTRFARVNMQNGTTEIVELDPALWLTSYTSDDVAVAALPFTEREDVAFASLLWTEWGCDHATLIEEKIGIGDEVAMIGRFVNASGTQMNTPTARFGNIAQMPGEPVRVAHGREAEVFLVEMMSLGGFSGAPVFVVIPPGAYRGDDAPLMAGATIFTLIGVNTGHFNERTTVHEEASADGLANTKQAKLFVQSHVGISIVAPAWKVTQLLEDPDAVRQREGFIGSATPEEPPPGWSG